MSKLRKEFSIKEWEECCTKLCKDCKIAMAYQNKFDKKVAAKKIKKDRKKILVD